MIIAMIVKSGTQELVSFGEGSTESAAKANAILAILEVPKEVDNLLTSELEWKCELVAD